MSSIVNIYLAGMPVIDDILKNWNSLWAKGRIIRYIFRLSMIFARFLSSILNNIAVVGFTPPPTQTTDLAGFDSNAYLSTPIVQVPKASPALLICQFGGYCRTASDCVAGNMCRVQNQYYSQCVADSST